MLYVALYLPAQFPDLMRTTADPACVMLRSLPATDCDQMGNKGALVKLGSDLKPEFITFEAVPHPPIRPMAYARSLFSSMFGM